MQLHSNPDPLQELVSPTSVRTLVVGEDPLVRESVVRRVRGRASETETASAAEAATRTNAEVVLWDLGPSTGAQGFHFDSLDAPVIALAPKGAKALPLLSAGAAAVLRRDVSGDALRSAIDSVTQGLRVIDPELLDTPSRDASPTAARGSASLTPREHDVLELLAVGLSNKQIAAKLGISSHTAKFHIGAILSKMDAATRTEAVVRAVQRGLIVV
ncbi:MAG: response regulator transcription factor [bacterium]|nr:response regulator transcription factor [bacterium]